MWSEPFNDRLLLLSNCHHSRADGLAIKGNNKIEFDWLQCIKVEYSPKKESALSSEVCVLVVVDYADTRFSNFEIEYLRKNKEVRENVLVCSYGAQVEYFEQKR